MNFKEIATCDFETLPIARRPDYPPVPVGVAIKIGNKRSQYYGWGHPTGDNNSTFEEARKALGETYESGRPLLFHNAKFDLDVAETHLGIPSVSADRCLDTMPMLFLLDPRAKSYGLKPSAEKILGLKPDERDQVADWLIEHQPIPGKRLTNATKGKNYAGAYVGFAPCKIVGEYARGDVDRTYKLARSCYPEIQRLGMGEALSREMRLQPHLLTMERAGLRVDAARLERDVARYSRALGAIDRWLCERLGAPQGSNWDSGSALVEALLDAGVATREGLGSTPTGQVQTNKAALVSGVTDPQILAVLTYRAQLGTCLRSFLRPWLETATQSGGLIYCQWHSTRNDKHGARTGRLSSTPNFQNIPKEFKPIFKDRRAATARLPTKPIALPPLPLVRSYIVPHDPDHVLIDRDFSQQEIRVLAHFEAGVLMNAYNQDPALDMHNFARDQIKEVIGREYPRSKVKTTNFGIIFGMGIGKLAEATNSTTQDAKELRDAIYKILPGLKQLYAEMRTRAQYKEPIRTWGGRLYYCEPPKTIKGKFMTFDYKLVNVLIQGSAADMTKEAVIRFADKAPKRWRTLATVHDEILVSVPRADRDRAMAMLKRCMESPQFDVPILSDGSVSDKNWATMKPYTQG